MQETQETRDRSMGLEDPLEEGMKTHSSVLAWRISWTEEPGGLQSMGSQRIRHDLVIEHNLITVHVSLIEFFSLSSADSSYVGFSRRGE